MYIQCILQLDVLTSYYDIYVNGCRLNVDKNKMGKANVTKEQTVTFLKISLFYLLFD